MISSTRGGRAPADLAIRHAVRSAALVVALAIASAGCGGAATGPIDVSLDDALVAATDWELAYSDDERVVWHSGEILEFRHAQLGGLGSLDRLEGAQVELLVPRPDGLPPFDVAATTVSSAGGRFRVGPAPHGPWLLRVSKDGYATGYGGNAPRIFGSMFLPDGFAEFGIRRGVEILVDVHDESGAPLPGARVRAQTMAYHQDAVTDEAGVARFLAPAGPLEIVAVDEARTGARTNVEVAPAETAGQQRFELSAPTASPLTGWVVDAETGRPLAGAVVLSVERPEVRTVTDEAGRYELVTPRHGLVAAFGAGRGWESHPIPPAGELELRLFPARAVAGRVVGPDGAGVAGARLLAAAPLPNGQLQRVLGPVTADDGSFSFDWCPEPPRGSDRTAVVVAMRRGTDWSEGVRIAATRDDVTLQLADLRRVEGVVRRASGAASSGVVVTLDYEPPVLSAAEAVVLGRPVSREVRCDPEGRFVLEQVPAAEMTIRYAVDGARIERRVAAGADARADLTLSAEHEIAGRIVNVAGEPVTQGGTVTVSALNHPEFTTLERSGEVSADGTFRIGDLPEGRFGVRASVPTYDVGGTVVDAGTTDVELVAERPAGLTFDLVFPEGVEPVPVQVELLDATDPSARARRVLIEPGAAAPQRTIQIVRRGRYHVVARGGAFRAHVRDVDVPDGARPPMSLTLERTLVRRLRLVDRDDAPLAGRRVRVACTSERGRPVETFVTGDDGSVEISGLGLGEWVARVVEPNKPTLQTRFAVDGAGGDDIVLRHGPYGSVVVRLDRSSLGAGSDDAIVSLVAAGGKTLYGWSDDGAELSARFRAPAEGDLVIRGVPAGDARVVVQVGVAEPRREPVSIPDGGEATVTLK